MNTGASAQGDGHSVFAVDHIQSPNRLWALPLVGGMVKFVIVLPVALWLIIIGYAAIVFTVINAFYVLSTGRYWERAYALALGYLRLATKANCFVLGLTDTYPGFSLDSGAGIRLEIALPERPSRFFALPLVGWAVRTALLVPVFLFLFVIGMLVMLVYWLAWIPVLLVGEYPAIIFDGMVYAQRLQLRASVYAFGLSDRYPLFDDGLGPDEWGPGRHDRVFRPLP